MNACAPRRSEPSRAVCEARVSQTNGRVRYKRTLPNNANPAVRNERADRGLIVYVAATERKWIVRLDLTLAHAPGSRARGFAFELDLAPFGIGRIRVCNTLQP